jgi:hypothetical protein
LEHQKKILLSGYAGQLQLTWKQREFSEILVRLGSRDSVVGIATRYGLEGPGIEFRWGEIFRTKPDRLRDPPSLLYNGYRVFPGSKSGRGVILTTNPLLVPKLRKSWAIPQLTLWVLLGLLRCSLYLYCYVYYIVKFAALLSILGEHSYGKWALECYNTQGASKMLGQTSETNFPQQDKEKPHTSIRRHT